MINLIVAYTVTALALIGYGAWLYRRTRAVDAALRADGASTSADSNG